MDVPDLIYKFFEVYCKWDWFNPVFIKIGKKKDNAKLNMNTLQILNDYS